jgi:acetyltransferase-like isoleucine patch superfamily enzyme
MSGRFKNLRFDLLMYVTNRIIANVPVRRLRLAFYRHVLDCRIGAGTYIYMGAWFDSRHGFRIGTNSVINPRCRLDNRGGITIGDNVNISADVTILTADHDLQASDFAGRSRPVSIGDYAFLGTRSMLLPGVTVGKGAAVAAGAIVSRDVDEYAIVAGIPARKIGERQPGMEYDGHYSRAFH